MNLPIPSIPVSVRPATLDDLPFIDSLQKKHNKMVGFMQTAALRGKIERGQILVAESAEGRVLSAKGNSLIAQHSALSTPLGYVISHDQYCKHDDVGIIYQMNIVPGRQRSLVGATLLKAVFDRAAYGCRLFCCWCAQDIAANRFWEAMGFVPLAYRAGSEAKSRVHIFWQRRIRAGDETTPYWYPSLTQGGSIREDRLVLPIPPGTHWSEAKAIVLPTEQKQLAVGSGQLPVKKKAKREPAVMRGMWFLPPKPAEAPKPEKPKRQKRKNDPKLVAAARELRDRWLEQLNADPLPRIARGKYDVSRALAAGGASGKPVRAIAA